MGLVDPDRRCYRRVEDRSADAGSRRSIHHELMLGRGARNNPGGCENRWPLPTGSRAREWGRSISVSTTLKARNARNTVALIARTAVTLSFNCYDIAATRRVFVQCRKG